MTSSPTTSGGAAPLLGPIRDGWLVALGVASGVATFGAQMLPPIGDTTRRFDLLGGPTIAGVAGVLLLWPLAKRGAGLRANHALAWSLLPQFTLALSRGEGYADVAASQLLCLLAFAVAVAFTYKLPAAVKGWHASRGPTVWASAFSLVLLAVVCLVAGVRACRRPSFEEAPPRAWIASALVGLVLALAILAWPRRVPESLLRWRAARQGTLSHDDVVTFADNTPFVRLPPGHGLEPGFVLMLYERPTEPRRESQGVQPFRDAAGSPPDAIAQGTQRDVLDAIECVESGPRVLATTVAVVSSTPLLVAAALGYVF